MIWLKLPVLSMKTGFCISSAPWHPHCYAKRTGFVFEGFEKSWVTKGSTPSERAVRWQGGNDRAGSCSNNVELAVPAWLWLRQAFSSDTELGIRTTSPVRRNPNKERPYELLIAVPLPSAAQHPFKIQIPFKSSRLYRPLSRYSLSTADLQEKRSNGWFRRSTILRVRCVLLPSLVSPLCYPMIL